MLADPELEGQPACRRSALHRRGAERHMPRCRPEIPIPRQRLNRRRRCGAHRHVPTERVPERAQSAATRRTHGSSTTRSEETMQASPGEIAGGTRAAVCGAVRQIECSGSRSRTGRDRDGEHDQDARVPWKRDDLPKSRSAAPGWQGAKSEHIRHM